MTIRRFSLPALAASALFAGALAFATAPAQACPGQEGSCACSGKEEGGCAKAAAAAEDKGADKAGDKAAAPACGCDSCQKGEGAACECGKECPSMKDGSCPYADGKKAAGDCACKGDPADCACKGDCPAMKDGTCPHAGDGKGACACGKDDPSCPCKGDCPAKKGGTCPHADKPKAEGGQPGAGAQRAVIDPATGALVEPAAGSQPVAAAPGSTRSAAAANVVDQPHGGQMAAFPKDRVLHAKATVDGAGDAHAGCGHADQ